MIKKLNDYLAQRRARKMARRNIARPKAISSNRSLAGKILGLPGDLFRGIGHSISSLTDSMSGSKRSTRDLLLGIPAILLFLGFCTATAIGHSRQSSSLTRYWMTGTRMLNSGDAKSAKIYLQKALQGDAGNQQDIVFSLARASEELGETERADVLMGSLAPVNGTGYPAAHRYLAVRTAQLAAANQSLTVEDLTAWQWHLSHADKSDSIEMQKAWGTYYLVGGDLKQSVDYLKKAAESEPAIYLQIAELQARMNDLDAVRNTLATARRQLEQQFLSNPGNEQNRLLYATSLFYIGELPQAEMLMKEGLEQTENENFRQLLAAVFVRMYNSEVSTEAGVKNAFKYLPMALEYDPNFEPALMRIVQFAKSSDDGLAASREMMQEFIAAGNSSALAYFVLGSLEWIAGNMQQAEFNMQQAIALDEGLPVVANNLAFLIATGDQPDYDSALRYVNLALKSVPDNPDYLDTRAMIYFKIGKLGEAAIDYQKALKTARDPAPIQLQLAEINDRMGNKELADQFRKAAAAKP